jgi:tetratricopeptide (TPR) repeat protein
MMSSIGKSTLFLPAILLFILLPVLMLFPHSSGASQSIYTIQAGSFQDETAARKQYDYVLRSLGGQEAQYLRIEKVGRFYTVRTGKFESYSEAEHRYLTVKPLLSGSLIMKAYMIDDRIIEIHEGVASVDTNEVEIDVPQAVETGGQVADEKADARGKSLPVKEVVVSIVELVHEKEYNAALYIAKAGVEVYPENPELNALMGTVLLKKGLPLESLQYLEKAVELSPDAADYHNALGYSWFFLKRYDKALDEFEGAFSLEPGHLDALSGLCMVFAETGETEKALELYNKVVYLDEETAEKLLKVIESKR